MRKLGQILIAAVLTLILATVTIGAGWAAWSEYRDVRFDKRLRSTGVVIEGVVVGKRSRVDTGRRTASEGVRSLVVHSVEYRYEASVDEVVTGTVPVTSEGYEARSIGDPVTVYADSTDLSEHVTEFTKMPHMSQGYYLAAVSLGAGVLLVGVVSLSVGLLTGRISSDDVMRLLTMKIGGGAN